MENKIRIKLENFEFEASGESEVIERERKIVMELIPQLISAKNYNVIEPNVVNGNEIKCNEGPKLLSGDSISINQFLKQKMFGSSIDITLGIIYYAGVYENNSFINKNSLEEYYNKSKTALPKNLSQNLSNLTQKGYIKTIGKEQNGLINYSITNDGESFIEMYEPKEQTKKIKKNQTKKTVNVKKEVENITRDSLNLHQYKKLKDIKEFKGKMMAAIYIVSKNTSIESYSINDMNYILLKIFQESNTIDQIGGVIKREPTWFNKSKNEDTKLYEYSLLREGIEFAEEIVKL